MDSCCYYVADLDAGFIGELVTLGLTGTKSRWASARPRVV